MPYQHLGEACQATQAACPGFPDVSGLNEAAFHWPHTCDYGASRPAGTDVGEQMSRATRCAPGLQCTGNLVPTLPGVCVLERPLEPGAAPPSGDDVRATLRPLTLCDALPSRERYATQVTTRAAGSGWAGRCVGQQANSTQTQIGAT